jgi:uncharacterized damage-inducible protein DinB
MTQINSLREEFSHEAETTRKHLERLPDDKLEWRPHEKSFATVELASHIVECIGWTEAIFSEDEIDIDMATYKPYRAATKDDLLRTLDQNVAKGKEVLSAAGEAVLERPWRLKMNGQQWLEKPKAAVFRDFVLSHIIHHRGQFSVYLRLLGVAVPGSYGPSADEGPPAGM